MSEPLRIIVRQGDRTLHSISLVKDRTTIGRHASNDVVLPDRSVSSFHAEIVIRGSEALLKDLASSRGTFVGSSRIDEALVSPGASFQIGPYVVLVDRPAAPREPLASVAEPAPGEPATDELIQNLVDLTDLVGITDLQTVLEALLERVMTIIAARSGWVVLEHRGELTPILSRGSQPGEAERSFSATVCRKAASTLKPVVLAGQSDISQFSEPASLVAARSALVVAVPLIHESKALGVLYLESDRIPARLMEISPRLLGQLSLAGGRALAAAMERRQLISSQERWRWLAGINEDTEDIFRAAASPCMKPVLDLVRKVAPEDVTVLILGESGTGKEVTARTIHRLSSHATGPFVAVNCGAIPKDLMEAELFGYEKGAFTGATGRRLGRFELAQGGTLLLDEIGDLPRDLQVKLLRVLESRTFERLGGQQTLKWDARLITATNLDLESAVRQGQFRDDLYYRVNVATIHLPPLRERVQDIRLLTNDFLVAANRRFRRKLYGVFPEALAALEAYPWPGNIRELRNVIERAFVLESQDLITPLSLRLKAPELPLAGAPASGLRARFKEIPTLADYLAVQEFEFIRVVLDQVGDNVTQAARVLGLTRPALHRKLRRMGLRGDG